MIVDHHFTPPMGDFTTPDPDLDPENYCVAGISGGELCGRSRSEHQRGADPRGELIEETAEAIATADDIYWSLLTPEEANHYRKLATVAVDIVISRVTAVVVKALRETE